MRKIDRTGETGYNNYGSEMRITRCRNSKDIDIYFPEYEWTSTNKTYSQFKSGKVICPYERRICDIAYTGEGRYATTVNGKHTLYYKIWHAMITRCYNSNFHKHNPTYNNCTVCEDWHNFQNFAEWCEDNYYSIPNETMELDKDILVKNNREYGPDKCVFVPHKINSLFLKPTTNNRDLPTGVHYDRGKYVASINIGRYIHIGSFDTPQEAFQAYKQYKEHYVKAIADSYRELIPNKLYNAMYEYEVEIDD